jgi:hypothetical protein
MSNQIALTSTSITAFNLTGSVATITFQYATSENGTYLNLPNPYAPTPTYTVLPAGTTYYSITNPLIVGYWYRYITRNSAGGDVATATARPFTLADKNAGYSVVVSNFTQPAVNSTVSVTVSNTAWVSAGSTLYIPNGGYYDVMSVDSSVSLTLLNTGMQENASSGTSIVAGSVISPSGLAVKSYVPSTTTTASYTQPSAGSNVQISVGRTSIFAIGNTIYISGTTLQGGIYTIISIDSPTLMTIQRVSTGNSIAGTGTIPSGAQVTLYPSSAVSFPSYIAASGLFGSGVDGDLLMSSSNTPAATTERHYRNIAWVTGAAGVIRTQFCRLFVSGVLDLTNCPVNGIAGTLVVNPPSATSSTGASASASGNSQAILAYPLNSGAGGNGGTGAGSNGSTASATSPIATPCGGTRGGGAGGTGSSGSGGTGGGVVAGTTLTDGVSNVVALPHRYTDFLQAPSVNPWPIRMGLGPSGSGGGGGGGDGVAGGGGGAGGISGGVLMIFANTIIRPPVVRNCISANGMVGGNGFSPTSGTNVGGGGGGAGGSGGIVYIYYNNIIGGAPGNLGISANGGNGGNGGNGRGSGLGGGGGGSGDSGVVIAISNSTGISTSNVIIASGGAPTAIGAGTAGSSGNTSPGTSTISI